MLSKKNIKTSLCSVPVEGVGVRLNRKRSEGSLGIVPKVAIVSLVEAMKRAGYAKSTYDFYDIDMLYPSDEEIRKYFLSYKPNVVGLSAVVSTSYSQVKSISSIIRKELPDCWIVMGGNLSACSEAVLKHTDIDISVVGDGEIAWIKILEHIEKYPERNNYEAFIKLGDIKGVAFLDKQGKINMNGFGQAIPAEDMPYPEYELLKSGLKDKPQEFNNYFKEGLDTHWFALDDRAKDENRGKYIGQIFASKGCVAKCTFCQRSTKGYSVQPLEHLENHLIYLKEKLNVGFIQILDENFGSNKKHAYQVADILHKQNLIWFAGGVRVTNTKEDDIKYYKSRGCSALKYGVESGSQKILDLMEKVFKLEDVYNALTSCFKHNVQSPIAVMVGMPGEDETTAAETGQLIGKVASMLGVHPEDMTYEILYALPLPGTPLWEYGEQVGVIGTKDSDVVNYLTRVADAGSYKRYYIHLNGAPISEILFWEYIVKFEASRTFRKEKKPTDHELTKKYRKAFNVDKSFNPRYSLKYTALSFTTISYLIDKYCVGNKFFDLIPSKIAYPVIKYLLYFEYLVQKLFAKNIKNNLFIKTKKVERLVHEPENERSAKGKSLRGHVMKKRLVLSNLSGPEKVRELLRIGL